MPQNGETQMMFGLGLVFVSNVKYSTIVFRFVLYIYTYVCIYLYSLYVQQLNKEKTALRKRIPQFTSFIFIYSRAKYIILMYSKTKYIFCSGHFCFLGL